ncbi:MAG TPA: polysaccharide biosynthesis C-terminal domain-containing protein, partial [Candidatus Limnocylindria bacterium]
RDGMEHLYRTTSKWTYAINLPLFLVLVLFPQTILGLFGKGFEAGSAALVVMAFAGLANAGTGTSGAILDMAGYTGLKLVNSGAALGTALLLNLVLIPPLGLMGAAIALTASTAVLNFLRLAEVGWLLRLNPYDRSFLKPTAAGVLAIVAALGVAFGVSQLGWDALMAAVAGIAALGLVYTVALVRLGLSDDDRAVLRGMWQRIRRRGPRTNRRASAAVAEPPVAEVPR